jgi:Xaa-Pro aminopeptidase
MKEEVRNRLARLRLAMKKAGVDSVLIPTADYHASEYVAPCFKTREYFSGFTGSAGVLIVRQEEAALWADGRYFIQAEHEIEGTGIDLMRMGEPGVPTKEAYLLDHMSEGSVLGFDGRCITMAQGKELEALLSGKKITINPLFDPADSWENRPALPKHKVFLLDEKYAGESAEKKLLRLRDRMNKKGASCTVLSKLDEIMWLFNIRGGDVECNPVALSYAIVTKDAQTIYLQNEEVTDELREYAGKLHLTIRPYEAFFEDIDAFEIPGKILLDPDYTSFTLYRALIKRAGELSLQTKDLFVTGPGEIDYMKSIKNPVEISNFRDIYVEDSVMVTKFIYYMKHNIGKIPMTEGSAAQYLDHLRSTIRDYVELSFPTISAYGTNAAMMHYEPDPVTGGAVLSPEGMLLVDSGGSYLRGTTDVTRTIALGPVTDEMRKSYTLTAVSNMQMMDTIFLSGCCGMTLDIMAREPMWHEGMDYKCGTGHGVGYLLNVHEGPQTLRYRKRDAADDTPFVSGMVITDEPGVYKAGKYGIRIENVLLCVDKMETSDGKFLGFEPLTFAPLDRSLLDPKYLTERTREVLNEYHRQVVEKISPYLDEDEKKWLAEECAKI